MVRHLVCSFILDDGIDFFFSVVQKSISLLRIEVEV